MTINTVQNSAYVQNREFWGTRPRVGMTMTPRKREIGIRQFALKSRYKTVGDFENRNRAGIEEVLGQLKGPYAFVLSGLLNDTGPSLKR